jgi:hypothetical protein
MAAKKTTAPSMVPQAVAQTEGGAMPPSALRREPGEVLDWYRLVIEMRVSVEGCLDRLGDSALDPVSRRMWEGQLVFYRNLLALVRDWAPPGAEASVAAPDMRRRPV